MQAISTILQSSIRVQSNGSSLTPCTTATSSASPPLRAKSPVVLAGELVMQRLDPLRLLPLAQSICRRDLEECRRRFDQPLGLDACGVVHVFLGCQDEGVVDDPFGLLAEQGGARVQVNWSTFDERLVALLGILASRITEEAGT